MLVEALPLGGIWFEKEAFACADGHEQQETPPRAAASASLGRPGDDQRRAICWLRHSTQKAALDRTSARAHTSTPSSPQTSITHPVIARTRIDKPKYLKPFPLSPETIVLPPPQTRARPPHRARHSTERTADSQYHCLARDCVAGLQGVVVVACFWAETGSTPLESSKLPHGQNARSLIARARTATAMSADDFKVSPSRERARAHCLDPAPSARSLARARPALSRRRLRPPRATATARLPFLAASSAALRHRRQGLCPRAPFLLERAASSSSLQEQAEREGAAVLGSLTCPPFIDAAKTRRDTPRSSRSRLAPSDAPCARCPFAIDRTTERETRPPPLAAALVSRCAGPPLLLSPAGSPRSPPFALAYRSLTD